MDRQHNAPCTEWAEKLALLHPDDLSPVERAALDEHVASCSACSAVRTQYAVIAGLVRDLPVSDVPEELPPSLLGLWEEEGNRQTVPAPLPIFRQPQGLERKRRVQLAAALVAALLLVGVLGSTIIHLVSAQRGNQTGAGGSGSQTKTTGPGPSFGGPAIVFGRFFTIHQSIIYLAGGNGKLLALRTDNGALLHSYVIGDGRALQAPVIVGNVLYDSDLNTLYALRVSDGSVLWHATFGDNLAISSPVVADGIVYITTSAIDHQVYALRASDGTVLWHYRTRGVNEELGAMTAASGIVYIGTSDGTIEHLYALNAQTGAVLWSHQFQELNGPGLTVYNGVIYASAGNALFALHADNGALLWTQRIDNTKSLEASGIAGNVLYILGNNGYVYALRLVDGNQLWRSQIAASALSASPLIIMNGTIYAASFSGFNLAGNNAAGGNVYALRADNGHIIWQKRFGYGDIPIMSTANGILYVTAMIPSNDMLYALRPGDGSVLWSKSLNGL